MNGRRQFVVLGLAATVLLLALALQFVRLRDVQRGDITTPPRPIGLRARIPLALPGWTGRDEPLGPTESVNRAVAQNLNFDEVCHRRYDKPGISLGVYVAYWSAGRMPQQKVASHTPDRCWSESGWTCTEARFPVVLSTVDGARWAVGGKNMEGQTAVTQRAQRSQSEGTEPEAFTSSLPSEPNAALGGESGASLRDLSPSENSVSRSLSRVQLGSTPVQNNPADQSGLQEEVRGQSEKARRLSPGGRKNRATSGLRSPVSAVDSSTPLNAHPSALNSSHALKPAYWRTFTPPGGTEPTHVLYWHLVGDELYDYGGGFNRRPGFVRWWRDMLRYAFAGSREQFFIRLMSNRPFEEFEGDAGFQAIVEALGTLGLKDETGRRKPEA